MTDIKELPNLVLDLHDNAGQIVSRLKKCIAALDDIANDKVGDQFKEKRVATKKLFASFDKDLSPNVETIANPKTKDDAVLKAAKAAKAAIQAYETSIAKTDDETQNLQLLTSKLASMGQLVEHIIKDPTNLTARKKLAVEDWSKAKKNVEKSVYEDLDELEKTYKKDKQRYIDTRKALGTVFSAKVIELLGVVAHLKEENAVAVCGKISPAINDILTKMRKEDLLSRETSTLTVDKSINSLVQYMTFLRDGVRKIDELNKVAN